MFIKIISAVVSSIVLSLYGFSGSFAYNFAPNFFILIILGGILSPMADRMIYRKFKLKGIRGILTIILAYLVLGIINGVVTSFFFLSPNFVIYFIFISVISSMIFLFFQTIFQIGFYKIRKRKIISKCS